VATATATVKLHANKLELTGTPTFTGDDGVAVAATGVTLDAATETATLTFPAALSAGNSGCLDLAFAGVLNDELAGFYRSKYTVRGEARNMAVTQFEATDARRAFPCFDEPALKAVFGVTVTAPADRTVVSNSGLARVDTAADGATRTWRFADTPVMSTYLVAVVVGEFDAVSARGADGIVTTVYTPVGKAELGAFALRVGVDALAYLAELFGIPYMGTKIDHLAIPDFAAGAMENTGAITYREAALLIDERESSLATKQRVAQVVAHELSHQWFGNYTTMAWWSGLFLNEGFAKHMEYVVTAKLFPEWNTFSHFTSQVQAAAFHLDAMASTHPIEVEVAHPDEVNEIFDLISYNKSASVLRMLFNWLRQDVAFRGLHNYMRKHAYGNAKTADLWHALAEVSGQPVADVMRSWTAMPGHPYLALSTTDRSGGALHRHSLKLESRRFIAPWALNPAAWPAADDFAEGPSPAAFATASDKWLPPRPAVIDPKVGDAFNNDWCMPVTVMMGSAAGSATEVKLGVLALDEGAGAGSGTPRAAKLAAMAEEVSAAAATMHARWFKVNADHANFYRTVYDSPLLARLADAVRTPADRTAPPLGVNDRLGLVGDVAAAVSVGLSSAADLLTLLWAMRYEADYNVWVAMLDAVGDVKAAAETVSAATAAGLDAFTRALLAPVVALVGWEAAAGEAPNTPLLRATVLRVACVAGDAATRDTALALFDAYAAGGKAIPADLRQLVYNTAASHGGGGRWEALLRLFKAATMSEEQRRLMTALGRASDPALLARAIGLMMTDDVRVQDAVFLLASVASNPGDAGRTLAWEFISGRWEEAHKRFGGGNFLWAGMIGAATGGFDTRERADEIAAFFATHPAGSAARKVTQSLEGIRSRVWRAAILARDPASILSCVESLLATA